LLVSRQQYARNEYVFPGGGREGYIIEPRKQMAKVTKIVADTVLVLADFHTCRARRVYFTKNQQKKSILKFSLILYAAI
jgi:hypothetical protein